MSGYQKAVGSTLIITKMLKITLPLIGIVFALYILQDSFTNADFSDISFNFQVFVLAFISLLAVFYMNGVGWYLINKGLGVPSSRSETIFVWLTSSVARYIPGVIWGYANRILFLKKQSISMPLLSVSFILEAGFLFGASVLIGINIFWFSDYYIYTERYINGFLLLIFGGLVSFLMGLYFFRKPLKQFFSSFFNQVTAFRLAYLFGFYLLLWAVFCGSFSIFAYSILYKSYDLATCFMVGLCFCLAFGLSFILIVFPSGIGVREVIFFSLMSPIIDPGSAALLSVLSRVWVVVGELASLLICLLWYFLIGKNKFKGLH